MFGVDHQLVNVAAVGPSTATSLAFSVAGQLRLAVIVKASFGIVPGAPMQPLPPEPLVLHDTFTADDPQQSLIASSDLVPFRPRADVVVIGHAHVPHVLPAEQTLWPVRLLAARAKQRQLDKRLTVVAHSAAAIVGEGFWRVPLTYELAARGEDNPAGVALPTVRDALGKPRPVGFGPIAASWPTRSRLLGDFTARDGLVDLAADFSWEFFQSAPPDQRLEHLHGDEWIGLEGVLPLPGRVGSQLPEVRAFARVVGDDPSLRGEALPLALDTVTIEADRRVVSLVWRAGVAVRDRAALATMAATAGVQIGATPLVLPAPKPRVRTAPLRPQTTAVPSDEPPPASLPFRSRRRRDRSSASITSDEIAPPKPEPVHLPPRQRPQTMALDQRQLEEAAARAASAVPFAPGNAPARPEPSPEAAGVELSALPFTGQFGPLGQAFLRALDRARATRATKRLSS